MTITVNPPPLQIPPEFTSEKVKRSFFSGLINTLYQLWTSVYGLQVGIKGTTTDNTPTAVLRVPVENGKTVMVKAQLVAHRTGGSSGTDGDSAWYQLMGAYKNVGGTLTGIGTPSLLGGEDQAGWDFYFSSSGQEIILTVLGATNNDITWEGVASTYVVGI